MRIQHILGKAGCALLLTAAVAFTACDSGDPAPPFEIEGTGSLEGLLFFDANGDGLFDPSAGDRALNDVSLSLHERGTSSVIGGTTTSTDASGRFSLTALPIGTHDLVIDTAGVGAGVAFCQNPIPVTVHLNETEFRDVGARAGCVISISEAEQMAQGTSVTIAGIVTAAPGQISTTPYWYVQDATSGVEIFSVSFNGHTVAVGDSVEVTGTLTSFQNELEVSSPGVLSVVVPGVREIAPVVITTKEAATPSDLADPLLGQLVTVEAAQLTTPFEAGAGRNATLDDGSGPLAIRIESAVIGDTDDINPQFTPGNCYTITGILRNFTSGPQLTPRSLDDIVEVACQ